MHAVSDAEAPVRDGWLFAGLVALLFWAPLPLGSNRMFAIGPLVLWAVVLLLGTAWVWRHEPELAWRRLARFRWPLLALGLFAAWVWLQTLPLPQAVVSALSPQAALVQEGVAPFRLSLDVHQTRIYAALTVAYVACFVVVLMAVRDRRRLDQLAMWIVVGGVAQAVLGVVLFSAGLSYKIFFFDAIHDRVKGSYGYHNHFAGYMELCLSVGIGLMLARLGNDRPMAGNWRHRLSRVLAFVLSPKMRLRMLLVVMVIALVLTRSRMGNTAFFASLLVVGALALLLTRRSAPAMVTLIISLVVIDVVVVGTWVGLEKVIDRVQDTTLNTQSGRKEESVELRLTAARHAVDMVKAFPVTGTGGGSFYNTYIRYRTVLPGYFNHAHNDYVELAADVGLVGVGLLGSFVLLTFGVSARTLAKRRSALPRGIAFGVMMAIVALAIHSTVDFNLQHPANALLLMIILAMGWAAHALPSGRRLSGGD